MSSDDGNFWGVMKTFMQKFARVQVLKNAYTLADFRLIFFDLQGVCGERMEAASAIRQSYRNQATVMIDGFCKLAFFEPYSITRTSAVVSLF